MDIARRITPIIPNSSPWRGSSRISAPAPTQAKTVVRRMEPHPAHPTPSIPLTVPMNPVAAPLCLTLEILWRIKKVVIAKFIPKRTAIAITNDADNVVKFVDMEPRRLTGKAILSESDPLEKVFP